MSDENSAISVTLKSGEGYEAPWINVRGDSPEEVSARLASIANSGLANQVAQVALDLQGSYNVAKGLGAQVIQAPTPTFAPQQDRANVVPFPQPTTPAAPAPGGQQVDKWGNVYSYNVPGAPQCPHGPRILKQGKKKDGSAYSAYICPQVDQFFRVQTDCKNQYV